MEALSRGSKRVYAGTRQPFAHLDGRVAEQGLLSIGASGRMRFAMLLTSEFSFHSGTVANASGMAALSVADGCVPVSSE
jgi:hypothetical protein